MISGCQPDSQLAPDDVKLSALLFPRNRTCTSPKLINDYETCDMNVTTQNLNIFRPFSTLICHLQWRSQGLPGWATRPPGEPK